MNVYEKLTAARLFFMNAGAKKSGRNAFAKYDYFELADILPVANRAAREIGFACIVRFGKEEATLEFVDTEKPEDRIVFTSPMSTADLKGCHPVQSLGAVETYVRRYLYLACFEITESDAIDVLIPSDRSNPSAPKESVGRKAPKEKPAPELSMTDEEMLAELKRILTEETYPDGKLVFAEEEKAEYWKKFKKNPKSTLSLLGMERDKRLRAGGNA